MTAFSLPVRVYIEDTDAGGIVYYVNYLKFMERSRTEFLRTLGYDKPAISGDGLLLVVHSAQIEYKRAARLDDELQVSTEIIKLARTYVDFKQQVKRGEELLCVGDIRVACVTSADSAKGGNGGDSANGGDSTTMRPHAIPGAMHKQLTNFIESQSQG